MGGPGELEVIGLGAFAGFTIFLGMPIARATGLSDRSRAALSAFATGILLFIFFDVLANANGLIDDALDLGNRPLFLGYAAVLLVGFGVGMGSLIVLGHVYRSTMLVDEPTAGAEPGGLDPKSLATMIAAGIGLHNFSEGLAIGASYVSGALALGTVLVVGFAIHNSTEGFGILGPGMMTGTRFSTARLFGLGLLGGGPTFLGTVVGSIVTSDALSILFYGLAAGAILFVVFQMARPMLGAATRNVALAAITIGFMAGYLTDLVVTLGGA